MKALGFRQANSWLHTWSGLLLGWLLYAIFVTGTVSFFRDEISFWMQPEQHVSVPDSHTPERIVQAMQSLAPGASIWSISLPSERNAAVPIQWFEQEQKPTKGGGHRMVLDAATAQPITTRETRGGDFLYRFHFELYGMPRIWARWIVGAATMLMLVAIVSGVITHKKIFADFFTFRRRKGQRSWMDAHNALGVLALPFHFMITYSGLLLLMTLLMPWGIQSAYQGDMKAYFSERNGGAAMATAKPAVSPAVPSAMAGIGPMLEQSRQRWPNGVAGISITQPGTSQAVVELRERGGDSLLNRGRSERMRFDGVTGVFLDAPAEPQLNTATAVYNVFSSLHLLRFAGPWLRWLFFISGLIGSAMIATGMVLWVVKRLPQRRKYGGHWGHRLVECLNVGTIAGLPLAIGAYFWANRLLPQQISGRASWEIYVFFIAWGLCLLHPLVRTHRQAWIEQLGVIALLFTALPLFSFLYYPDSHLVTSLSAGHYLLAGMDMTLLAFAAAAMMGIAFLKPPRQAVVPLMPRSKKTAPEVAV